MRREVGDGMGSQEVRPTRGGPARATWGSWHDAAGETGHGGQGAGAWAASNRGGRVGRSPTTDVQPLTTNQMMNLDIFKKHDIATDVCAAMAFLHAQVSGGGGRRGL
jgi:hypothetical protein